jgi:hypothetical protein
MLERRGEDAPATAGMANVALEGVMRNPVKTGVRMLAIEPESFALEAKCVIVCPEQTVAKKRPAPTRNRMS